MNVFDAFELGSDLLAAGMGAKNLNKWKKEFPEAYHYNGILSKVCMMSSLNYRLVGGPNGEVILRSTNIVKGFSQPVFHSYATVIDPSAGIIGFFYFPEKAEFVVENSESRLLLNWINARLAIGSVTLGPPSTNMVGRDVRNVTYSIAINWKSIPDNQTEQILKNFIDNLLAFREIYMPIIQAASELKISFQVDKISGENASKVLGIHQQALAQCSAKIQPGRRELLKNRLAEVLKEFAERFEYEYNAKKQVYTLKLRAEDTVDITLVLFINSFNQIVVQLFSPVGPRKQPKIVSSSDYIDKANTANENGPCFGNYHANLLEAFQLVYTNGLDARGFEEAVQSPSIGFLIDDHYLIWQTALGLEYMMQPKKVTEENHRDVEVSADQDDTLIPSDMKLRASIEMPEPTTETVVPDSDRLNPPDSELGPTVPQQPTSSRVNYPPKNRTTALLLEILPGLVGILGIGWLYSGNVLAGLLVLVGMLIWDVFVLALLVGSAGVGIFCICPMYPIFIALSAFLLHRYTKSHTELFGL